MLVDKINVQKIVSQKNSMFKFCLEINDLATTVVTDRYTHGHKARLSTVLLLIAPRHMR